MRLKPYADMAVRVLTSNWLFGIATGVAAGTGIAFGITLAIGTVGFSTPVVCGLLFAAALGIDLATRQGNPTDDRGRTIRQICFVAWLLLASAIADAALTGIGAINLSLTLLGSVLAGLAVGLVTIALPTFLAAGSVSRGRNTAWTISGCAGGLVLAPLMPMLPGGSNVLALSCVGFAAVLLLARLAFGERTAEPAAVTAPQNRTSPQRAIGYLQLVTCGAVIAVIARVVNQTMLTSAQGILGSMGILLGAVFVGSSSIQTSGRFARLRRAWNQACSPAVLLTASIAAVAATIVLFPQLVRTQLWLVASVQSPIILWLARIAGIATVLIPVGLLIGNTNAGTTRTLPNAALAVVIGLVTSMLSTAWLPTPALALVVTGLLIACFVATIRMSEASWVPKLYGSRLAAAGAICCLVGMTFGQARFQPTEAARLLFSSGVFQEYAAGTKTEDLLTIDDTRLLETTESTSGITSRWRQAGTRIQVRQNGLPTTTVSVDTSVCPQPVMATMPVVLPLVLHSAPEDILLLGDSGSVAKATSLMFPLQSVTSIDQGIRSDELLSSYFTLPSEDERFTQMTAEPAIAIAGMNRQFDVVVNRPPQATLLEAAPYYTTEFYKRVRNVVRDEGLFCQTFNQIDFGPRPLLRVLKSLRQNFNCVSAVQLEHGEIMLVATDGETVIQGELAKRANFVHVRRILDELGWDWSRVLGLASLDSESVDAILSTSAISNTTSNAAFAWGLPLEMMRWGDKRTEIRKQIAGYQRRILDQLPQDDFRDEAARRLAEIGEESEVLFGFPDEPWMYRKTLRTRLEQNPRPPQELVVGKEVKRKAHDVDDHRVEYFRTLANAIQSKDPQALDKLKDFLSPTEPLVSYFATHELARIYAQRGTEPGEELRYRLRSTYFTPAATRSVREIVAAVEIMVKHPELIEDPADRWDQMNSLLQVLMVRWGARKNIPPSSARVALNDIEKCLSAIDSGLSAMDEWRKEANINSAMCASRARYLRTRLERPLRRYRDELLPHHYKAESELMAEEDADTVVDQFRTLGN